MLSNQVLYLKEETTTQEDDATKRKDSAIRPDQLEDDEQSAQNITQDSFTLGPDLAESSCSDNVCRNGGTCLSTLTGPKCHCPLQFSGRQCEEEVTVETPGFVGEFSAFSFVFRDDLFLRVLSSIILKATLFAFSIDTSVFYYNVVSNFYQGHILLLITIAESS